MLDTNIRTDLSVNQVLLVRKRNELFKMLFVDIYSKDIEIVEDTLLPLWISLTRASIMNIEKFNNHFSEIKSYISLLHEDYAVFLKYQKESIFAALDDLKAEVELTRSNLLQVHEEEVVE